MRLNNGINKLRKHVMTMYILMKRNLREILLMLKLDSNFKYKFSLFEMLKCGFLLSYVTLCHAMLGFIFYTIFLFEMCKCGFMLSYVTLCHAMLRYVMLFYKFFIGNA